MGVVKDAWFAPPSTFALPGLQIRLAMIADRFTVVGVMLQNEAGIDMEMLRSIPVHRIEAAYNSIENQGMARKSIDQRICLGTGHSVAAPTDRRIAVPAGGKYPDAFYRSVAMLYQSLVVAGERPAPVIAEANAVPVSTVHRWIKEARARGILAPARKAGATG
jgi:hypothetical protein